MASLKLSLRAGERLFLNGAVLRVDRKTQVELLNDVTFLLESHVMQAADTKTPLRQLYFILQMMLIDPARIESDAGLPKNAVLGRQYVQGAKLEPGDRPQKNMEGVESLDMRPLDVQARDPLATNTVEKATFIQRYMPCTKDRNYRKQGT